MVLGDSLEQQREEGSHENQRDRLTEGPTGCSRMSKRLPVSSLAVHSGSEALSVRRVNKRLD